MNVFTKSVTCLIYILAVFLIPVYSLALSEVKNLNFAKLNNGKTEIKIDSTGEFQYFITASGDDLIINIKNALFTNKVLNLFDGKSFDELKIKGLVLENVSKDLSRLTIQLNNLSEFKFLMNASNGIAAPYGFNSKIKVKSKKKKSKEKNVKQFQPPQIVQQKESIKVFEETAKKPATPELKNNNLDSKAKKSESDISLIQPVSQKALDPSKKHKRAHKKVDRISGDSSSKIRLDSRSVYLPKNYFLEGEKSTVKDNSVSEKYEETGELIVEQPEEEKKVESIKPIPSEELLKRLASSTDEEITMPRLLSQEEIVNKDIQNEINTDSDTANLDQSSNTSPNIKFNIKPLPKGKVINIEGNVTQSIEPDGSKTIEISSVDQYNKNNLVTSNTNGLDQSLLLPREIDSLPLGLSEEIDNYSNNSQEIDIPDPKPGYTSDGAIAFTVISSEGVVNAKAPVRNLDENNVTLKTFDDRVIETSEKKYNLVRQQFKELIQNANKFYQAGNFDEAEKAFRKAIKLDPKLPWGYLVLASFYDATERYEDAINAYDKALNVLPNRIEIIYNQGLDYYKLGEIDKAINKLNDVISLSPEFTLAYYNLGTLYFMNENYENANKYLNMAVERNPVLIDAHFNLGLSRIAQKDFSGAKKSFENCLDIDPDDNDCLQILSQLKNQ